MRAALVRRAVVITPKRAKVLEILATSDDHPNVGDLHAEVQRWHPSTSLATVYNIIELLKETGQVLELEFSAAANILLVMAAVAFASERNFWSVDGAPKPPIA